MKTTVQISNPLLADAKKLARERGTTLRAVLEAGLRKELSGTAKARRKFRFKPVTFRGHGLQPGIDLSDWSPIRALIYEGRGG